MNREDTQGLVIDFQERLVPAIHNYEEIIKNTKILLKGLKLLDIPLTQTGQYIRGLGGTVSEIKEITGERDMNKITFSCMGNEEICKRISDINRKNIIICGIESHICVYQTVKDLKDKGYNPVVAADCIGSRKPADYAAALSCFQAMGVYVGTTEMIIYEQFGRAGSPEFKEFSKLIK
ncbi:MAG: isochorismatase family protein [Clostridiales bacterium]|nr:isochorismatase family protein [Clostridiales bacterium]